MGVEKGMRPGFCTGVCEECGRCLIPDTGWRMEKKDRRPRTEDRGKGKNVLLIADIGTTTIALNAVDKEKRRVIHTATMLNPQIRFGADVITRISHEKKVRQVKTIDILSRFITLNGLDRRKFVTVVGNTVMMHFLFGKSPKGLGVYPYTSRLPLRKVLERRRNGLRLRTLPLLGAFLGSDCTAAILAAGIHQTRSLTLLIDAGTNGEVVLGNRERIVACSTAAGPAFEGATLSCGALAVPGAIASCRFYQGGWHLKTVGGLAPEGICGSGVLDAIAEGVKAGLITKSGRLKKKERLVLYEQGSSAVYLTQADIREVQLAKAAIASGIKVLLREWQNDGGEATDALRVFITGRFGGRINPQSAFRIGLLPGMVQSLYQHPDLALTGAKKAVLQPELLAAAKRVADITEEILLSTNPVFQDWFINSMELSPWRL